MLNKCHDHLENLDHLKNIINLKINFQKSVTKKFLKTNKDHHCKVKL